MAAASQKTWVEDPTVLHQVAARLEREHTSRVNVNKAFLRLRYQRPVVSTAIDFNRPYREIGVYDSLRKASENLTAEIIDASAALICRPLQAKVLPVGGDFELQRTCRQFGRAVDGVLETCDFLDHATEAYGTGCAADVGPIKLFVDPATNEIRCEEMDPNYLFWPMDGTRDPITLVYVDAIPRETLIARHSEHEDKIRELPTWRKPSVVGVDDFGGRSEADTVKVVEGWCRALGPDSPGRHSIVAGDIVLVDEEWTHEVHPVVCYRWQRDFRGFGGVPLARRVGPYDLANKRLTRMVYAGLAGAVPWLLSHEDSEVDGVSDVEFQRIRWSGPVPPQVVVPQTVSPEVLQRIDRNIQRAYAEAGVNQGAAAGQAPTNFKSGEAQKQWIQILNTRLVLQQKNWERLWRDAAHVIVCLLQSNAKVRVRMGDILEEVRLPKLPRDKYRIGFGLVSGLSLTVSGRLDELVTLKEAGAIDDRDVLRNLGLPDTQALADRANAPRDLAEKMVSKALEEGEFTMPSAIQDLQTLVKIGSEEYQRAQLQGTYPARNLEALRRLIKAAEARLKPPAPLPVPPPGNDNGGPPMPEMPEMPPGPDGPPAMPPPAPPDVPAVPPAAAA